MTDYNHPLFQRAVEQRFPRSVPFSRAVLWARAMVPEDWIKLTLGQMDGEKFTPTELVVKPGEPTCFFEGEEGIPFRGQDVAKELIDTTIETLRPGERFKVLLVGAAGTGKTTLAWISARRLIERRGGRFFEILATQIAKLDDLARFVETLEDNDIVFLDEIHIIPENIGVEPLLHILADTGEPRLKIGTSQLLVPPSVSWIGATTDPGRMDRTTGGALRRRFDPIVRLEALRLEDMVAILQDRPFPIDDMAALDIAERSNQLPWHALSIYDTASRVAMREGSDKIYMEHAMAAFRLLKLDEHGLNADDYAVLRTLLRSPVSMASGELRYRMAMSGLCAASGVDEATYRSQVQPKLLRAGLLQTVGGQSLTDKAIREYGWLADGDEWNNP